MSTDELKAKARHEIDTPGHPSYGESIFTFTEKELEEFILSVTRNESPDNKL